MPEPIDLSAPPLPPARRSAGKPPKRGGVSAFLPQLEEFSQRVFWVALLVSGLLLAYLLWGLESGAWSHQSLGALGAARRLQQTQNIASVMSGLRLSLFVAVVALLIVAASDETIGYALLGVAAIFYFGLPYAAVQWFALQGYKPSVTSQTLLINFQSLAWLFFLPGLAWVVADIVRRLGAAAEQIAIQRVKLKYGANVASQPALKQKRVFLGRCWEGPYCRENIRVKCPIYLKKQGPCWWYKSGCMCEESIVLQAIIDPNWRSQAAKADPNFNYGKPRAQLTPAAKRQRCRDCIIYNEHQRQKHKALSSAVLVATVALLSLNAGRLHALVDSLLVNIDSLVRRFAFSDHPGGLTDILHNGQYEAVAWVIVGTLCIVILSQALKLVEYCCYTLKI